MRSVARGFRSTVLFGRTRANWRERLHQVDKLGVTGSSPVPPIEKPCKQAISVCFVGDGMRRRGKDLIERAHSYLETEAREVQIRRQPEYEDGLEIAAFGGRGSGSKLDAAL